LVPSPQTGSDGAGRENGSSGSQLNLVSFVPRDQGSGRLMVPAPAHQIEKFLKIRVGSRPLIARRDIQAVNVDLVEYGLIGCR
jgi:hypothetical protein